MGPLSSPSVRRQWDQLASLLVEGWRHHRIRTRWWGRGEGSGGSRWSPGIRTGTLGDSPRHWGLARHPYVSLKILLIYLNLSYRLKVHNSERKRLMLNLIGKEKLMSKTTEALDRQVLRWILWTGLWGADLRSTSGLEPRSRDAIGQAVLPGQ